MIQTLFAILAPVAVAAGIGVAWVRLGRPFETRFVTDLVTNIGAPCLIFTALVRLQVGAAALAEMALVALAILALAAAAGFAVVRLLGLDWRAFLPALAIGNHGNMGLPLCLFAFGEAGLALGVAYFAVTALVQFTAGHWVASGALSPGEVLRQPIVYALAAAVAVLALGVTPPAWLLNTTLLLGGMTIPLMLISLGVSLARMQVGRVPQVLFLSACRLAIGFAAGHLVVALFALDGVARGVALIQATMPVAVFNYLFAQYHGRDAEEVAGLVVLSTLLACLILPALLYHAGAGRP
ncbi:MAG: AEC family transporter [Alphaproteobacteria bacterium]|nr:AEC family transporter [Alphaproteobacteria bacterium]